MLPHYSPYKVAENFRVLEALYPNRIDLGVGRAPGGMPIALRTENGLTIDTQNKLQTLQCTYMIKYQKTITMQP